MRLGQAYVLTTLLIYVFSFVLSPNNAQSTPIDASTNKSKWTWKDNNGHTKQPVDLEKLLAKHLLWLKDSHSGIRLDLHGADLSGADLSGKNLSQAQLSANFSSANLTGTNLNSADMSGAILNKAILNNTIFSGTSLGSAKLNETDLRNANLDQANLSGTELRSVRLDGKTIADLQITNADLSSANLRGAFLLRTNLSGANMSNASLAGASLKDSIFSSVDLSGADLYGALFEITEPPKARDIARARNLEHMSYTNDSEGLARLRQIFKEAGFRDQERKITYALKIRQVELLKKNWDEDRNWKAYAEYWINTALFDWTCQYGMNPGRVLITVIIIFLLCTTCYLLFIHFSETSGLSISVSSTGGENRPPWLHKNLVREPQLFEEPGGNVKRLYRIRPQSFERNKSWNSARLLLNQELVLIRVAVFFSLMSTFNIKFRDVDFGRWLRLLTTKEYDIKATGHARTVAGLQALLSVYFIALLLVTYFGRPFE
jgi:uncharacterized protein YjbI with pentapeptide repeats